MKLRADYKNKGFSLLEILLTTSLFIILVGIGLWAGIDLWRNTTFHLEEEILVSILQKARSLAINNSFQTPHGVRIETNQYIIFRGATYDPATSTNEIFSKNSTISTGGISEIVFAQLVATPMPAGVITITNGLESSTITINEEGAIAW